MENIVLMWPRTVRKGLGPTGGGYLGIPPFWDSQRGSGTGVGTASGSTPEVLELLMSQRKTQRSRERGGPLCFSSYLTSDCRWQNLARASW